MKFPKDVVEKILAALKAEGIEIEDTASLTATLQGLEVPSDQTVPDGKVLVDTDTVQGLKTDLFKAKKRARTAEERIEVLENDDTSAKKVEELQTELKKYKPLAEKMIDQRRKEWESVADKIPDDMKTKFTFDDPEKGDAGKISDDQVIANMGRVLEYSEIGALKGLLVATTPPPKNAPRIPKTGESNPLSTEDLSALKPAEKMEKGYANAPTPD
jgi:hypothetical protein